jgi:phosphoribosylanthranilate isomerase
MGVAIKICGITNSEDAHSAAQAGADFIGVIVEIEGSPRSVSIETAQHIVSSVSTPSVLLLEKQHADVIKIANDLTPYAVQLIGNIEFTAIEQLKAHIPCKIWKTLQIPQREGDEMSVAQINSQIENYRAAGVDVIVLDTLVKHRGSIKKGGTGQTCDWKMAHQIVASAPLPVFLAGGITPLNVREAVMAVRPQGIDVSSGVELKPGKKDSDKIIQLIQTVRAA